MYDLASLLHRSTDHYENWHVYVFFGGESFCGILFAAAPHQVVLQPINFCTVQSISKLPTWSPKMMPTWHYRQHFAMFPLNHRYNVRNGVACDGRRGFIQEYSTELQNGELSLVEYVFFPHH
ncbi:uncharacterized protein TNCV_357171 [Trichonephila clavipes]|nr:uncharacterized protein TNCV_357171 [Trichonephila clavipes]